MTTETQTPETKTELLSGFYNLCYAAHSNTSFSPERRSEQIITSYSEQLKEDLILLGEKSGNYKEKYIEKFTHWMGAKSRCISSMITGPANFPVRRAQKYNSWENSAYENFQGWRDRYFKAVNRIPTKSPEDDLTEAIQKYDIIANNQMLMKLINSEIKKSKLTDEKEIISHLLKLEYPANLLKGLWAGYGGNNTLRFAPYTLTNNNARIKATKDKIMMMKNRIERKKTWEDILFDGGRVTLENDRINIIHDEKPEREIIQEIKRSGFRWSPHWVCWTRKHTGNAIYSLRHISFIKDHIKI